MQAVESLAEHTVHSWRNISGLLINSESTSNGSNHSVNGSTQRQPDIVFAFISGILILTCLLVGICGNLWIVATVLFRREMRGNLINLFVTSLCLNDLLNLLLNQTMVAVSYLAHGWVLGKVLCDFMPEFNMVLVCVSLWHHALIALHRYIVVVHNNTYIALHKGLYSAIMLLGTRLLAALLSLSYPVFNNWHWVNMTVYQAKMLRCIYEHTQRRRILGIVLLTQFLPCVIIIVCFALIFMFVHRTGRRSSAADRLLLKREIQITKMFGAVFILFLVGFLPYGFLRMFDSDNQLSPNAYLVVTVLYAVASCANPVIFGAMNREIRLACLQLLPSACRSRSSAANNGRLAAQCRARGKGLTVCISMQQRARDPDDLAIQESPVRCNQPGHLHVHQHQQLLLPDPTNLELTNFDSNIEDEGKNSSANENSAEWFDEEGEESAAAAVPARATVTALVSL